MLRGGGTKAVDGTLTGHHGPAHLQSAGTGEAQLKAAGRARASSSLDEHSRAAARNRTKHARDGVSEAFRLKAEKLFRVLDADNSGVGAECTVAVAAPRAAARPSCVGSVVARVGVVVPWSWRRGWWALPFPPAGRAPGRRRGWRPRAAGCVWGARDGRLLSHDLPHPPPPRGSARGPPPPHRSWGFGFRRCCPVMSCQAVDGGELLRGIRAIQGGGGRDFEGADVHADVREVTNIINKYDTDMSGEIDVDEFVVVCRDIIESSSPLGDTFRDMLKNVDANEDAAKERMAADAAAKAEAREVPTEEP